MADGTARSGQCVSGASSGQRKTRRGALFGVVSTALFMSSLDQTVVATALHSIQHGLHTSVTWAGWTLTIYALGRVLMLPVAGKLSEQYGKRRIFLASVAVFTTASLCCGLVNNIYLLVALRAIQAAGGAAFTPAATGIVVDHFGSARDRAVGLFGSIFPIGAAIGPIVGGLFVAYWSWRGIFLINVPIGAALIPLGLRYIPADHVSAGERTGNRSRRLDVTGMLLLGSGVVSGMLAITHLAEPNARLSSWSFVVPTLCSVLLVTCFWRHIHRSVSPFLEPRLITGKGFGAVNVINVVYGGVVAGSIALVPLYATNRYGIDVLDSGTLLSAQAVAVIVMSGVAAFALRRTGYRVPLYFGAAVMATGLATLAFAPVAVPPYAWLAAAAFVIGLGNGWSGPASRNACLQLAPERAPSLASLRTMGRQIGSITTVSIATAVIEQGDNPGLIHAYVYVAAAVLLLVMLPAIARVPEHRGAW